MISSDPDSAVMTGAAVESQVVEVDGIPMSALVAEARHPRAVVLALHGGAATSAYFDHPDQPRLSLLRTGAELGFTVIALDRPGYGASTAHADEMTSAARRVDLAYAAVDRLPASRARGAGVFVMAHSIGCELAVRMAADDERGADLLGVEISGTGLHYQPRARELMEGWKRDGSRRTTGLRDMLWQPARLYPADFLRQAARISSPAPAYEGTVSQSWTADFPELAARVRIPVRYSLGDHEMVWRSGSSALAYVAATFTASPRVAVSEQTDGGHNLSLGLSAMAYHLKVLSFVEECVLARKGM
jgi:alpha-beta hydrolase superfamily lysophospholipase